MNGVAERLAAGPAQGLGVADAVAREAAHRGEVLGGLVSALADRRPHVQTRAANALKKVQQRHPELLAPFARRLLRAALECEVLQAQWNLTVVVGALALRGREKALAVELLFEQLQNPSALLRTFALTGLCDLAAGDEPLRSRLRPVLNEFLTNGTPAMRARARKLLARFGTRPPKPRGVPSGSVTPKQQG